jgi:hypothetical protein
VLKCRFPGKYETQFINQDIINQYLKIFSAPTNELIPKRSNKAVHSTLTRVTINTMGSGRFLLVLSKYRKRAETKAKRIWPETASLGAKRHAVRPGFSRRSA